MKSKNLPAWNGLAGAALLALASTLPSQPAAGGSVLDLDNALAGYGISLLKAGNYYSGTYGLELWVLNGTNVPASINSSDPETAYVDMVSSGFSKEWARSGQAMSDGTFVLGEVYLYDVQPPGSEVVLALAAWTGGAVNWVTAAAAEAAWGGVIAFVNATVDGSVVPPPVPPDLAAGWDAYGHDLVMTPIGCLDCPTNFPPLVTWPSPAPITYGTALSPVQLNATPTVPGSELYTPSAGAVLPAGTYTLSVVFTPTDATDFKSATNSVDLVILPAPLTVTASSLARPYGQVIPVFTGTVTGVQRGDNISASYNCAATTASPPGTYPIIPSLLDPDNRASNYAVSLVNGTLTVYRATPTVSWANPAAITYGTLLSSVQLNATASVPGSEVYSPPAGTLLQFGLTTLSTVFTPTDATDYNSVTASVSQIVLPAPLTVTAGNSTRSYSQPNPVFTGTVAGIQRGDNVSATYSCSANVTSVPGDYAIVPAVVFSPNGLRTDYQVTLVYGTLRIVPAAPPVIAGIVPGTGPTNGFTAISILGSGFEDGARVYFGSMAAAEAAFVNSTNLTATSPPGALGAVNIVVTNADGQAATLTNGFTYLPQVDSPIALNGYNRDVVVENTATGGDTGPYAQPFDSVNHLALYEAGLGDIGTWSYGSGAEGLPANGTFTSALDGATVFQLQPYGGSNVLHLDANSPSGSLMLAVPAAYSSLSLLSASANGGGMGSLVIQFFDGSTSAPISFNASDWLGSGRGAAVTQFGEIDLGDLGAFFTVDPTNGTPNLYQSTTNLAAAGLSSKPILSLTFTMPVGSGGPTDTGIFAVSGTRASVPLPPGFLGVIATPGTIHFTLRATAGQKYQLEYKTNLSQSGWSNLGGNITATNSTAAALDSIGPDRQRFYRAVWLP